LLVDLLFASSGIEHEIASDAAELDIGFDTPVPVARPGHLIALKLLADDPVARPQDALDLRALRPILDDAEIERARVACLQIVERGFHRGRDLQAMLETLLVRGVAP